MKFVPFEEAVETAVEEIQERKKNKLFLPTPWEGLNLLLGGDGFRLKRLVVIGARPRTGKTLAVLLMALKWARQPSTAVWFFSFEMTNSQITERALANLMGAGIQDIENGIENESLVEQIRELTQEKHNLFFCEEVGSSQEIYRECLELRERDEKLKIVIVDHTRLVKRQRGTEKEGIDQFLVDMNEIKKWGFLVIVLSQLNRRVTLANAKENKYEEPNEADFYGTDALFQFGDYVITMYNPSHSHQDTWFSNFDGSMTHEISSENRVFANLEKCRDGGTSGRFVLSTEFEVCNMKDDEDVLETTVNTLRNRGRKLPALLSKDMMKRMDDSTPSPRGIY